MASIDFITSRTVAAEMGRVYSEPDISGNWITFSSAVGLANTNVHAMNLATGESFPVAQQIKAQYSPDINGTKVVWTDRRNDDFRIYLFDLETRTETLVTAGPGAFPSIWGEWVVYHDNAPAVHLYNTRTKTDRVLGPGRSARIRGDWVICQRTDANSTEQIRAYNIKTGQQIDVTAAAASRHQIAPDIWGSTVAWSGWDGSKSRIYYTDLSQSPVTIKMIDLGSSDHHPTVSGSRIYFKSNAMGPTKLFLYDLGGQAQTPEYISPPLTGEDQNEYADPDGDRLIYRVGNELLLGKVNAPTISLASLKAIVPYNTQVRLTGDISDFGVPIGAIPASGMMLQAFSSPNAWNWQAMQGGVGSDALGRFSYLTPAVKTKTYYRLVYKGAWNPFTFGSHLSSVSALRSVTPKVSLNKPAVPKSVRKNKSFTAKAYIQPAQKPGSKPIRVEAARYSSGKYRLRKTVWATASYYSASKSTYAARLSLPYSGRWRIRAVYPTSATNAYTKTGWVYRTVP